VHQIKPMTSQPVSVQYNKIWKLFIRHVADDRLQKLKTAAVSEVSEYRCVAQQADHT